MNTVFLIMSFILAGAGLYLAGAFFFWLITGDITRGRITGFQKKKDKGLRLPIVTYEDKSGQSFETPVERIDQIQYFFNRPQKGDFIRIIRRNGARRQVRIYGYAYILLGGFLCAPLFISAGLALGSSAAVAQTLYVLLFAAMITGGWMLLKLIQRYY